MKTHALVILAAAACFAAATPAAGPDLKVERLGDRAAVVRLGEGYTTSMLAVSSRRGLVLVDTGSVPAWGAAVRAAVEREFGRKDFAYVVNTHFHYDHTNGNQAFPEAIVVAHRNAVREMRQSYGSPPAIEAFFGRRAGLRAGWEAQVRAAGPDSPDGANARELLAEEAAMEADFRGGRFVLTPPAIAFDDRMSIDLGDLTLDLIAFGRAHTESDILVGVPELGLLHVGDLFHKGALPFYPGRATDPSRWFRALDALPAGDAVRTVVSGHGERMTGGEFRARAAYLRDVWDGVAAARKEGATLAQVRERLSFEPALAGIRTWRGQDLHALAIEAAWRRQSDSAAQTLESLIAARGLEAAVAEYRKTIAGNERYDDQENEMNALGYRFLQGGRLDEALAAFRLNADAHPGSWNAWDSLAEGWLRRGDEAQAEAFYAKSVELNPANENGKRWLGEIRSRKLDAVGETREPLRFAAGAKTGLDAPYLGQTPPGAVPVLFAPGIVSSAKSYEFAVTFTPDGREMYFTRRPDGGRNAIMVCRWGNDGWTAPEEAGFSRGYPSNEPFVTPDGRRLYFGSARPRPGQAQPEYGIWSVERAADGAWGEPGYHGPGMYVSATRDGDLYMTDVTAIVSQDRPVVVYPKSGEGWGAPRRVGGGVNAPTNADHAFVAPDGSYILFDSSGRPGAQGGEGDLHVCFREADGSWSEAYNLGDAINTPGTNFCPSVSPDGKYIFYSMNRDIYWVSAKALDGPRAEHARKARAAGGPGGDVR